MKPNKSASHKYIFPGYTFNEGKCYYKNEYFGDVIHFELGGETKDIIQVIRKDGNRYADGEMVTFHMNNKKQ